MTARLLAVLLLGLSSSALAADKVKVGFMTTQSGPAAAIGTDTAVGRAGDRRACAATTQLPNPPSSVAQPG